jgi:predicted nuclease with TOPRIM domain
MRSNLRSIILLNGVLVDTNLDISGEVLRESVNELNDMNNELNDMNNELNDMNNELNNELNYMNNELNYELNDMNNELVLFLLNRSNRMYYLFAQIEQTIKKDTLTIQQIENLERCDITSSCPICMEEIDKNIKLQCTHIFCVPCIEKWLLNKSNTCPICRVKVE